MASKAYDHSLVMSGMDNVVERVLVLDAKPGNRDCTIWNRQDHGPASYSNFNGNVLGLYSKT